MYSQLGLVRFATLVLTMPRAVRVGARAPTRYTFLSSPVAGCKDGPSRNEFKGPEILLMLDEAGLLGRTEGGLGPSTRFFGRDAARYLQGGVSG
jgi:hypothetical protein